MAKNTPTKPDAYWDGASGQWLVKAGGEAAKNSNIALKNTSDKTAAQFQIENYITYLKNGLKETPEFLTWNARQLVWDMGNLVKLSSIRNTISKFKKTKLGPNQKLKTLKATGESSASSTAMSDEQYQALWDKLGCDDLTYTKPPKQ